MALAVFEGLTLLQPGVELAQPHLASDEMAINPIVDWATLARSAETDPFTINADLADPLEIDGLPRPIAPTGDMSVPARAIVEGGTATPDPGAAVLGLLLGALTIMRTRLSRCLPHGRGL